MVTFYSWYMGLQETWPKLLICSKTILMRWSSPMFSCIEFLEIKLMTRWESMKNCRSLHPRSTANSTDIKATFTLTKCIDPCQDHVKRSKNSSLKYIKFNQPRSSKYSPWCPYQKIPTTWITSIVIFNIFFMI